MWEVPQAPQLRRGIQTWLQLSKEVTTEVMEFLLENSQFNDVMCTVNAVHFFNLKTTTAQCEKLSNTLHLTSSRKLHLATLPTFPCPILLPQVSYKFLISPPLMFPGFHMLTHHFRQYLHGPKSWKVRVKYDIKEKIVTGNFIVFPNALWVCGLDNICSFYRKYFLCC